MFPLFRVRDSDPHCTDVYNRTLLLVPYENILKVGTPVIDSRVLNLPNIGKAGSRFELRCGAEY